MPKHKLAGSDGGGDVCQELGAGHAAVRHGLDRPVRHGAVPAGRAHGLRAQPELLAARRGGVQLPYADRLTIEIVPGSGRRARAAAVGTDRLHAAAAPRRGHRDAAAARRQGKVQIHELGVSLEADSFLFNLRPARSGRRIRARGLDHAQGVPAGDLTRRRSRRRSPTPSSWAQPCRFTGRSRPAISAGSGRAIRATSSRGTRRTALLASIGLTQRDQDEWLEDAQGNEARFTVLTFRGNSVLERGAAVVRDDLQQGGHRRRRRAARDQYACSSACSVATSRRRSSSSPPAIRIRRCPRISGSAAGARISGTRRSRRRRPSGSGRSTS